MLNLLAAHPDGLSRAQLQRGIEPPLSQPTLSRLLTGLRGRGQVTQTGRARATRYHLVGGRIAAAELRSRLLHAEVAERMVHDPALKQKAVQRLDIIRRINPSGRRYHERWAQLLDSPLPQLLRAMTEDSEQAAVLRRDSPFTVLYDRKLRQRLLKDQSVHMPKNLIFSRPALTGLCRRHHVRRLSLFGSAVREDFRPDSDVDLLVEFEPGTSPGLGGMSELREELSALFGGRKIDLATPAILRNPHRRSSIERDLETVYEAR